ncbi:hypothetical protein [Clostridium drakei]|uniref:Aldolase n=1 Tax=Clostridium drakei TaxID=332101 RepID=A0A2U8DUN2_9CLOT|nr:hypothetical protein [Clostridium drakei]AWI06378.1 hypothetical protein B9W14_18365 [Clostridium drakei]
MCNDKNRYLYRAFGLKFISDFYLPELIELEESEKIDVNIVKGKVPIRIDKVVWEEKNVKISQNELIFEIDDVGKYYLRNGNFIIVEPDKNASDNSMRLYLLGMALGTLLLQRDMVSIHGSIVVIDGKAIILSGVSGAGKSTLSSAFRKIGHLILTDDISVIKINEEGIPIAQPGYPQQKLWSDSLEIVGEDKSQVCEVSTKQNKYSFTIKEGFLDSPVPLVAIFEISPEECNCVEINQFHGVDKLNILLKNIYRGVLFRILGTKSQYFKQCLEISKNIEVFKLVRPKDIFSLEDQVKFIKQKIECLV